MGSTLDTVTRWGAHATIAAALAGIAFAGCTDLVIENVAPTANAGKDQDHAEASAEVTLDGSKCEDPDGVIVAYEWHYTGDPRGADAGAADEDAGVEDVPEYLRPLPAFCPVREADAERGEMVPVRWCELEPKGKARVHVMLDAGVYRFTLWVTDDAGAVSADSVVVSVGQ